MWWLYGLNVCVVGWWSRCWWFGLIRRNSVIKWCLKVLLILMWVVWLNMRWCLFGLIVLMLMKCFFCWCYENLLVLSDFVGYWLIVWFLVFCCLWGSDMCCVSCICVWVLNKLIDYFWIGEKIDFYELCEVCCIIVGVYEMYYEIIGEMIYIICVWYGWEFWDIFWCFIL